jgi:acetolactate synthase-1/2/3 large subunit
MTTGEHIIASLKDAGVRRLFGMPGGGSNADLVEAAGKFGLPFSLAHTEAASAFMACAQAEITGEPGACIATLGPGAASIMNGVAHAYLDRVALAVITDRHPPPVAHMQHQSLPHKAMFAPITKLSAEVGTDNAVEVLNRAMEALCAPPPGPVHLDISAPVTSANAGRGPQRAQLFFARDGVEGRGPQRAQEGSWCERSCPATPVSTGEAIPLHAQQLLRRMRIPLFLVGLGARTRETSLALRQACEHLAIPALVTYKAKGVVGDQHPWFAGLLTNGALERNILQRADGFIAVGLDSVELLPVPWLLPQPVVSINPWPMQQQQVPTSAELVGDLTRLLAQIQQFLPPRSHWSQAEVAQLLQAQRNAMRPNNRDGKIAPYRVVEIVAEAYPKTRLAVDAGAHMFPVMSLWPAAEPRSVLISNGLSTMGFALPAAIGAALLDCSQPTLALTGDGGLMMCLGELRTAAREKLPLRIIVFDDQVLSLIKIKQIKRGYKTDGVTIGDVDWETLAGSMGVLGRRADTEESLRACLRQTAGHPGPVLIAARISEQTYPETMQALRG